MCPIKLQHVQLLGQPTGTLAFVGMLIGDNWSHAEVRTSIYGQCRPRSNHADACKDPRKARNVTRLLFRRLFPFGHETSAQPIPMTWLRHWQCTYNYFISNKFYRFACPFVNKTFMSPEAKGNSSNLVYGLYNVVMVIMVCLHKHMP